MHRVSCAFTLGLGLALVAIAVVSAENPGGNAKAKKTANPVAMSAASIAAGKAAYEKNCRFCHGADAKGNGPSASKDMQPPDLTDAKWDRGASDGEIYAVLSAGAGPDSRMKGYEGRLSHTEMWNIVNYLRSLDKKK